MIVSGVGKSGLIGQKIAATLTSTGTPAVFLHPADALHGDAGLFARGDVALFISKSGATEELMALLPYLDRLGIPLVSIVVQPGSPLAQRSAAALVLGPLTEACPMDLTPTTSVTLTQVVGDCLAIALMEQRGFKPEDFRFLHPGGVIGRTASRPVRELMHAGDALPRVSETTKLRDVMLEIMNKRLGITAVLDGRRQARRRGERRRLQAHPVEAGRPVGADGRRRDVAHADHDRARRAGRERGAHHGGPPAGADHRADRGGRRARSRSACCTCTTACAQASVRSEGGTTSARSTRPRPAPPAVSAAS